MTAILPRCETCFTFLVFETDWIGRVYWRHPEVRCVAPPPIVYEPEDEEELGSREVSCVECGAKFRPRKEAVGSQIVCGGACRKKRRDRKHVESEERRGKYWKTRRPQRKAA